MNRQRRMALSRRLLNRRLHVEPVPAGEITRPLSDAEVTDALRWAFDRATRGVCATCGVLYDRNRQSAVCPHPWLTDDDSRS